MEYLVSLFVKKQIMPINLENLDYTDFSLLGQQQIIELPLLDSEVESLLKTRGHIILTGTKFDKNPAYNLFIKTKNPQELYHFLSGNIKLFNSKITEYKPQPHRRDSTN